MEQNVNQDLIEKYKDALEGKETPQEPGTQDANVEVQQEKESSIQKLKRQRNEARDAVSRLEGKIEALASQINQQPSVPKTKDEEVENLRYLALTDEKVQEAPGVANQAVLELAKKIADEKVKEVESRMRAELQSTVKNYTELQNTQMQIQQEFGAEAFNKEGDLYQVANAIVAQEKQAWSANYGDKVEFPPKLYVAAFHEARARLPKPEPVAEETTKPTPDQMVEGGGYLPSADDLATIKSAATKAGNVEDAFSAVSRRLGYE